MNIGSARQALREIPYPFAQSLSHQKEVVEAENAVLKHKRQKPSLDTRHHISQMLQLFESYDQKNEEAHALLNSIAKQYETKLPAEESALLETDVENRRKWQDSLELLDEEAIRVELLLVECHREFMQCLQNVLLYIRKNSISQNSSNHP